jgi:transcriptional regulator with XRE-family HTH domain
MSPAQLAASSGLTPAAVSRYLSGKRQPTYPAAQKLAAALGVAVDYLLNPEGYAAPIEAARDIAERAKTKGLGYEDAQAVFEAGVDVLQETPTEGGINWRERALAAERKLQRLRSILGRTVAAIDKGGRR